MSETDRQSKNPRPQGKSGAVPVLFSLRNVQPCIVVGTTTDKTSTNSEPIVASSPTPSLTSATTPLPNPKPAPIASKNNRSYNIVVGLLIIAVCMLVIKNTQKSNASPKNSIAAKQEIVAPVDSKSGVEPKTLSPTPVAPKSNDFAALDLNPPVAKIPSLPESNSKLTQSGPAIEPESAVLPPDSPSLKESNTYQTKSDGMQSLAQQQAPLPMLLNSARSENSASATVPSMASAPENNPVSTGLSFPETRTAMKADVRSTDLPPNSLLPQKTLTQSLDNNASTNVPNAGNEAKNPSKESNAVATPVSSPSRVQQRAESQAAEPKILDTREPYMSTRSLIDKYMVGKSITELNTPGVTPYQPESSNQRIPVSPVSNTGPKVGNQPAPIPMLNAFNNSAESGILSGSPYPPVSKEYQPISIPAYEQGALNNAVAPTTNLSSQTIRQPTTNSNRYMNATQPPVAPIPYKPMAPQSGMIGYPPSSAN